METPPVTGCDAASPEGRVVLTLAGTGEAISAGTQINPNIKRRERLSDRMASFLSLASDVG